MIRLRTAYILAALALAPPACALAQQAAPAADPANAAAREAAASAAGAGAAAFELTVANIMRGPELVGSPPGNVRWTDDGRWIYFRWQPGGRAWHEPAALYRVAAGGGEPERLSEDAADSLGVLLAGGDVSPDERRRVVSHRGDLYLIERRSLAVRRLTETRESETSPVFSNDGGTVYFLRDDNVFALELDGGAVRQLTDIRRGPPPEEEAAEGQRKALEEQQRELFEHIRRRLERREEADRRREAREARELKPVHIGRDERVSRLSVDPAGRYAVLEVIKPARDARRTVVPDWVTPSGYAGPREVRAKVGDAQEEGRAALLELGTGEVRWLELGPPAVADTAAKAAGDAAVGEPGAPAAARDSASRPARAQRPPLAAIRFHGWNQSAMGPRERRRAAEAGQAPLGLIGVVAYDYRTQWLYVLDAATGELRTVAEDRDSAWIGGPCADWARSASCAGWLPDGRTAYFLSERDGFSHLYTVGSGGGGLRQLTRGEWEVASVEVAPGRNRFLLGTSEGSPFEQHVHHMAFDGSGLTRVTAAPGRHDATVSPDGRRLAVVHSYSNRPPELFVMDNRPGAEPRQLTSTPTDDWRAYPWLDPEIVWIDARDGVRVPARIYRPRDVGARANGAGVIFVHGAGYLHNVHRWWSSYYREYMFHHLLASRGYTVLDIDYRGSAGYGRNWRTAIYRHMGGKDLSDQVDGARWLARNEGVDPNRVGIYGGSYGGFITLMALFTEPESFAAGAALRSVTDWAHYNHWYTRRILNLPHEDEEAYRRSSPIYFAEGLRGALLIAHGMVDVNVHFQDVVRLAQRLIELGKTNWEMAVYPVEDHGFVEPSSWTDEYRRILELFERHLAVQRSASEER